MGQTIAKSKHLHKGDRLKWEPISTINPAIITGDMLVGKRLSDEDLRKNANYRTNYRIP